MKNWIISQNEHNFHLEEFLNNYTEVSWEQAKTHFSVGDIVYIYNSWPNSSIQYKMEVIRINLDPNSLPDDSEYHGPNYDVNKTEGLCFMMRFIKRANQDKLVTRETLRRFLGKNGLQARRNNIPVDLLALIDESFVEGTPPTGTDYDKFVDSIRDPHGDIPEGAKSKVYVNRYERNIEARLRCIRKHGCKCAVCDMDFEKTYGPLGRGFIHVHHITPISEIGMEYKVNPSKDLIPVCPNCHAMLHRGKDGRVLTVQELRNIIGKE